MLTEASGFVTIVCGTFLLHATRDLDIPLSAFLQLTKAPGAARLLPSGEGGGGGSSGSGGVEMGEPLTPRSRAASAFGLNSSLRSV